MRVTSNLWIEPYKALRASSRIRELAFVHGVPLTGLDALTPALALKRVEEALERIFVPTKQCCEVLGALVEDSLAYATDVFPSVDHYVRRLNSKELGISPWGIRLITGLAGIGKTTLVLALGRVLPDAELAIPGHGTHQINRCRLVKLGEKWGTNEIRRQFGITEPGMKDIPRFLYGSGCASIGLDETQFMGMSRDAHVRAAKVIMQLNELGPPLHVVTNFSLGHNLGKGNHEIRARILASKISVLVPEAAESDDWRDFIAECAIVLKEYLALDFDLTSYRIELWNKSAGIKRNVKRLLMFAYEKARSNRRKIAWADIEHAYGSLSYSDARSDVMTLLAHSLGTAKEPLRKDLQCPFPSDDLDRYEGQLRESVKAKIARAHERDQLTANQKAAHKPHMPNVSVTVRRPRLKADRSISGLTAALVAFQEKAGWRSPPKT